jgi:hypothetical protein
MAAIFEVNPITHFDRLCKLEKRGDEIKKNSSSLKLLSQSQPNFADMILGWSPFKIVSISTVLYPRWPPLLKIEISSNGQNCSMLSQKVSKFELYKHNDVKIGKSSKFIKNPLIYVKKLFIMLIQFKFGQFLA